MNNVRTRVKEQLGEALLRTGVWERTLRRWARREETIILGYHRIIEKWSRTLEYSQPAMVVTADTFDRQLTFLKKHFYIVALSDLVNPKCKIPNSQSSLDPRPSTLERPLCALTFDDGWRDNYKIGLPILQKHKVPATIFLTADFIGTTRTFWHTELIYVLMHGDLSRLRVTQPILQGYPTPVLHNLVGLTWIKTPPSSQDVDPVIRAVEETCDRDTIKRLIENLSALMGLPKPFFVENRFFLDWNEVREMASAGIEIGSHGCSHRVLTRLKMGKAEEELIRSKAEIERKIDGVVYDFAFPFGAANRGLLAMAQKAGYRAACVSDCDLDEERFECCIGLRRLGMHEAVSTGNNGSFSDASFCAWLARAPRMKIREGASIRQGR